MLKKIIIRLSVFLVILVILDMVIGSVIRKIYFKQNHGTRYKTTYLLETAHQDIMILGSSKALHHYIAGTIEDSMKATCFNGGREGYFIGYSNAALNSILKRYAPKMVIVDVTEDEFEEKSYKFQDKLSCLLPYYKTHPEIRDIVNKKSRFEKYKLLSGMYTFNTLLLPSITGSLKKEEEGVNGYLPLNAKWDTEIKMVDAHNEKLDSNKIVALRNIIAACKEKKVPLAIVISPTYKLYAQNYNPTIELAALMADSNHVPFWNYQFDTSYINNREYFNDIRHMNNDGAKVFTTDIIKKLKALQ